WRCPVFYPGTIDATSFNLGKPAWEAVRPQPPVCGATEEFAMTDAPVRDDTLIGHAGCRPQDNYGIINPPVYHASTVLFPTVAALEAATRNKSAQVYYGRDGTPTTFALEEAAATLEEGEGAIALPSGLAGIAATLTALLKA